MRKFIQSALLALALAGAVSAFAAMHPQNDPTPYRQIVIAPDAPEMTKLAARELQHYVKLATGTEIPICADGVGSGEMPVILVGASAAANRIGVTDEGLKPEGFRIVSMKDILAIVGRDYAGPPMTLPRNPWRNLEAYNRELGLCAFGEAGTLYGVYRFLHDELGIRWFWPGDDGEVVPTDENPAVPEFTVEDAPEVNYRYPWFCLGELAPEQLLWLRRCGFGGIAPVYIMHSFDRFQVYRDSHPEYFALVDGKRDFDNLCALSGGGNLCLSNPAVIDQWVADIDRYFDEHPNELVFPLVPMDGLTRVCECDACQKQLRNDLPRTGRYSDYIWNFVNRVAAGVAKTHPDKIIGGLAYESYFDPPQNIEKLNDNVAVMICYARLSGILPGQRQKLRQGFEAWKTRTDKLYTWNWYLENLTAWKGLPVGYPELYCDDINYLQNLGIWGGEFIQAGGEGNLDQVSRLPVPGMQHLNLYLTAQAMWHSPLDVAALLDDYFKSFYGPAEAPMRDYWTSAFAAFKAAAARIDAAGKTSLNPDDVYDAALLERMSRDLAEAQAAVPPDSVYARRIRLIADEFLPAKDKLCTFRCAGNRELPLYQVAGFDELAGQVPERFSSATGGMPRFPSWVAAGSDGKRLYLQLQFYVDDPARIDAPEGERDDDAIWRGDVVEIFISPNPADPDICYQFVVNPAAVLWDAAYGVGGVTSKFWNSQSATAETSVEPNRWRVQFSVSLSELDITPEALEMGIPVNFYRGEYTDGQYEYSPWSPTFAQKNYFPSRFGKLKTVDHE